MNNYYISVPTIGASGLTKAAMAVFEIGREYDGYLLSGEDIANLAEIMQNRAALENVKLRKPLSVRLSEGYGGVRWISLNTDEGALRTITCKPIIGAGLRSDELNGEPDGGIGYEQH